MGQEELLRAALADRYQIEREIGEGGMAVVFLAKDLKHDRLVAVKVLRPELSATIGAERFLREIQISARLNHPHILTLIDSGEADDLLYYVMPYVDGESLRDRMEREGQLPVDEALKIVREVADGLGYAHRLDIVHRDIKPENVLLSEGHAIVTDFGIAKAVSAAGGRITRTGGSVGSPLYMSPEQAAGRANLDGRSDLYSLACMLFEMLTGEPPFSGQSLQALIAKHALETPPDVRVLRRSIPEPMGTAIRKALSKTPADRFKTVTDFSSILSSTAASTGTEPWDRAEATGLGRRVLTPSSITVRGRRGWSALFLGAALVGSTVLGMWFKTTWPGPDQGSEGEGVWSPGVPVDHRRITLSGDVRAVSLSPDGSYVVLTKNSAPGLFLMRVATGGEERLIADRGLDPTWTPDGNEILFYRPPDEKGAEGIYAVSPSGGPARWVGSGFPPITISPDGKRLIRRLFWDGRYRSLGDRNTFVSSRLDDSISYDTLGIHDRGMVIDVKWSPSGEKILVTGPVYDTILVERRFGSEIRAPDGTFLESVFDDAFLGDPSWVSGDRSFLFTSGGEVGLPTGGAWGDVAPGKLKLATLEAGGWASEAVAGFDEVEVNGLSVSANGKKLAYVRSKETARVMVAKVLAGGRLAEPQLASGSRVGNATSPVFSPDEQELAFASGRWIFVAHLSSGVVNELTRSDEVLVDLMWSGDGSTLGFTTWNPSTRISTLFTAPAHGGPLRILGTNESLVLNGISGDGLWISYTGDSLLFLPRSDTIFVGWSENDVGSQPLTISWTDGRQESSIPLAPQRLEHWGTLGPTGREWISVASEGFTVSSLEDGSIVREIPLEPPDLPSTGERRVGVYQDFYYLGPVNPFVWTREGWIYFGYLFPPADGSEEYLEIWRVREEGGVPEPALFGDDGSPRRFPAGLTVLSAQSGFVGWVVNESESDAWIAEVSPGR